MYAINKGVQINVYQSTNKVLKVVCSSKINQQNSTFVVSYFLIYLSKPLAFDRCLVSEPATVLLLQLIVLTIAENFDLERIGLIRRLSDICLLMCVY